jgi:hypothetical protein
MLKLDGFFLRTGGVHWPTSLTIACFLFGWPFLTVKATTDAHRDCHFSQLQDFYKAHRKVSAVLGTSYSDPKAFPHPYPESKAVFARRVDLWGSVHPGEVKFFDKGKAARISPAEEDLKIINGTPYYEMPNSTGFSVKTETGWREYVITRGIRRYENLIRPLEGIFNDPQGYVSDLLISERVNGELGPAKQFLVSRPDKNFFFEDPRISVLYDSDGHPHVYCSGTDYSRQAPGSDDLFIRNRFFEVPLDPKTGEIGAVPVDPDSGKPVFFDLSPEPKQLGHRWIGLDAKNGTIAQREDGKIIVRTRFRPNFAADPTAQIYQSLYGRRVPEWSYGEQVFAFDTLDQLKGYDWSHAMDDLLSQHLGVEAIDVGTKRIRPFHARIIATDHDLPEFYPKSMRTPGKPVGFGPGSRSIQIIRKGMKIFISDGPNAPKYFAGEIGSEAEARLLDKKLGLSDHSHVFLAFDHKLRYLDQATKDDASVNATKRVYSGSVTIWDSSLLNVVRRYDDVIQPKERYQISLSGVLDLHLGGYTMGVSIVFDPVSGKFFLRTYSGEADAHTESRDWDIVKLLLETVDPEREPQAYSPKR